MFEIINLHKKLSNRINLVDEDDDKGIIKQLTKSKYNLISEDFRIIDNSVEIRTHIYTFTHL